jgi:hypothetical protein
MSKKPKESAYKIEGLEIVSASTSSSDKETKVVEAVDIKALLAMGDLGTWRKSF